MNDEQYRLDIVGLEDDSLPAVTNLEDGSTYYTADTQKLYVLCKGNWYLQGESEDDSGDDTPDTPDTPGDDTPPAESEER